MLEAVTADDLWHSLPMNIDAQTLRALLAPHAVHSSRFFADTRVQPPQLVAYVRCVASMILRHSIDVM